ncbi:ribonuclease CAF1 [Gongronella butleri]|nr:ribonuclease CAF1 [Gongronella butleri]
MSVTYTEVTNDNFERLIGPILQVLGEGDYVAFDCEFSGFAPKVTKHMDQRYAELSQIVRTHTLFSFGLTVVSSSKKKNKDDGRTRYNMTNFEFVAANTATFQANPSNLRFLAENGLDFGRIFRIGIPFQAGDDTIDYAARAEPMRRFWRAILKTLHDKRIPVIVHNGLLDIMYLYQSFIANLPTRLATLVADLVQLFPGGFYDTKFLATDGANEHISYLSYVFTKCKRLGAQHLKVKIKPPIAPASDNAAIQALPPLLTTPSPNSADTAATALTPSQKRRQRAADNVQNQSKKAKKDDDDDICAQYARHGHCGNGRTCVKSHDIERIMDRDLGITIDAKSVKAKDTARMPELPLLAAHASSAYLHSAHYDAYMTAYAFCYFKSALPAETFNECFNKINLMRLDVPLRIAPSHFASTSTACKQISASLWP